MAKFTILLLRNIEGCGVTRCAIEHQAWYRANGHECTVYALKDKSFPREKVQQNDFIQFKIEEVRSILAKIQDSDVVMYYSLASKKHSERAKNDSVNILIKEVKPPKVMFQFDHKKQSFSRNHAMIETASLMDAFFTHSLSSDFAKLVKSLAPIFKMGFGVDYSTLTGFRKDQSELVKKLTYFSRFASFKDPHRMLDLFPMLSKHGFITEMNGVERSIGSLRTLLVKDGNLTSNGKIKDINIKEYIKDYTNGRTYNNNMSLRQNQDLKQIYTFGPYQRDAGLECLSYSMFGADFYNLKPSMYGGNFENAMCEIIGVGSIPVFDYHFAEHCKLRGTDTLFKDIDNFAVFSKKSNLQETVDKIVEIASSQELIKKYRETSLEVATQHSDINNVMVDIVSNLETIKKKTNYEIKEDKPQLTLF